MFVDAVLRSRMGALVRCRNLAFDVRAEEGRAADQTQTFRCDGAGVRVSFQAKEIAGELYRIKPAVRCCALCAGSLWRCEPSIRGCYCMLGA